MLEACAETGHDKAAFVAQLTRLTAEAAGLWLFASLPVVLGTAVGT